MTTELLSVADAAQVAGLSENAIHRAIAAGRLAATLDGRRYLIASDSLTSYLLSRQSGAYGETNARAVLTAEDVHGIRARLRLGESIREIAAAYNVSKNAIHSIKVGRTWSHLK